MESQVGETVGAAHGRARAGAVVVIAGGGIAAAEAALALRAFAGYRVKIQIVAPDEELVYRPLTVLEPFGEAPPPRLPYERLTRSHAIEHVRAGVERVDAQRKTVELSTGETRAYDALIVATGARTQPWLPGAITFGTPGGVGQYRALLHRIEAGEVAHVVFAPPFGASWPLGLYDLILLTSMWREVRGIGALHLTMVTPENAPLAMFGRAAGSALEKLLGERQVEIVTGAVVVGLEHGRLRLADGHALRADAAVTLPRLVGHPLEGLPADDNGFIPTDAYTAVERTDGVFAVGDVTTYPLKQGGLAAQQADAAAACIAARLGARVEPRPFEPVVRALLFTGVAPLYLRAGEASDPSGDATVAEGPLWWPPTKVVGRFLGPYLAGQQDLIVEPELSTGRPGVLADVARNREMQGRMALDFAEMDAQLGELESALEWLDLLDEIDESRPEAAALREEWQRALGR